MIKLPIREAELSEDSGVDVGNMIHSEGGGRRVVTAAPLLRSLGGRVTVEGSSDG